MTNEVASGVWFAGLCDRWCVKARLKLGKQGREALVQMKEEGKGGEWRLGGSWDKWMMGVDIVGWEGGMMKGNDWSEGLIEEDR